MPKGTNYAAQHTEAEITKALASVAQVAKDLDFVPNLSPDLLTNATIRPERLELAVKAVAVAEAAPTVMRRATPEGRLAGKLATYRQLLRLHEKLGPLSEKIKNALNVLGSDMLFDVGNIHEDVEKDNGETVDLGALRTELHEYYRRRGDKGDDKGASSK